ncbi:phage major capsid protein [Psychrobacillus lasiicapitis]|uniref:Phage major capsid protein n=1 Tax=Psychrobacillus lasiicapitis TaxID=1636719 RepID=A0A544TAG3_9BACI|nr:phage major capsid protein [Psychrobacillus lasiicapitis]TQR14462.1 phage major capsid protein [Psychrobacillus lasiicapitis]GGA31132.1 major capsid protein [Psychrobacillus lasiicapitis]
MKNKQLLKANIKQFDFNPDNVLLMDAKTGTIPTEQGTLVLTDFMQNSVVAQIATYENMTKPKKEFTYLADGPGAYWVGEAERIQTSKAEWLKASMEAKKLGVIIPVSKEFLRYSVSDFFNEVKPMIAEAFYTKFDQAALFGNGSPYTAGTSVWERITASGNTIEIGSTPNLYTDLNGLVALVEDGDHDANGFTTTRRFRQKLRGAVDGQNKPIFNDTTAGAANQVLGMPVGYVDGKAWDYSKAELITGDWKYARYGILQGIEYAISEDATLTTITADGGPVNLFERDMFALRATMHIGFMTLKDDAFAALTPDVTP